MAAEALRAKIKVCRLRPFGITPHQPDLVVPDMQGLADLLV
jgi:hypothetical protein